MSQLRVLACRRALSFIMLSVRDVFNSVSRARLIGDGAAVLADICTDSRTLKPGELFVALRGDNFDANQFAVAAQAAGANAVLVERWVEGLKPPALIVADARIALGEIAIGWRQRFTLPVIAVTGSNGKTTVKEMIAAILTEHVGAAHALASPGNLNNDVGVPLSVFRLRETHRAAVLELGMNRRGEIAWLARIAQPQVALVNNAQREHQEFLDSVQATALENGAALAALPDDGTAVFPGDDACTSIWRDLSGARRRIEFGLGAGHAVWADASAQIEGFTLHHADQTVAVSVAIAGQHNVRNALAAAASCLAIDVPLTTIARGLAAFKPVKGRLVSHLLTNGTRLIDDSYNANPDSVRAAIDVLASRAAPRVLVLGDMGEVGTEGPQFHVEVGAYARERGVDHLLAFGSASVDSVASFGQSGEHFDQLEELNARARMLATRNATVLVKGSRFMRMERVVAHLLAETN